MVLSSDSSCLFSFEFSLPTFYERKETPAFAFSCLLGVTTSFLFADLWHLFHHGKHRFPISYFAASSYLFFEVFRGRFCAYYDVLLCYCCCCCCSRFSFITPLLVAVCIFGCSEEYFLLFLLFSLILLLLPTFLFEIFGVVFCAYHDGLGVLLLLLLLLGFLPSRPSCCSLCFLNGVKIIVYYYCYFLLLCALSTFFWDFWGCFCFHCDGLSVFIVSFLSSRPSCCSLCFLDAVKNSFYYYSCFLLLFCFFRPFFWGEFWDDFCSCYDGLCVLLLLLRIGFLSLFSSCCILCFLDAVKNIFYYDYFCL